MPSSACRSTLSATLKAPRSEVPPGQDLQQPLIGNDDQRVHGAPQGAQAFLGQHLSPAALELERLGHDRHGQASESLGDAGDDRSAARPGTAAHAGGDEHHVGIGQMTGDFLTAIFRGAPPDFRIRAGALAPGQFPADLQPGGRQGRGECLHVGIGGHEFDAGAALAHVVQGVAAAHAHDLDGRPAPCFLRRDTQLRTIIHGNLPVFVALAAVADSGEEDVAVFP